MLVFASTALAAGNSPKTSATVGNCISDGLYGNEPNMADGTALMALLSRRLAPRAGNVLPTQSPGPWVNNPADPDNPTRGKSAGAVVPGRGQHPWERARTALSK